MDFFKTPVSFDLFLNDLESPLSINRCIDPNFELRYDDSKLLLKLFASLYADDKLMLRKY